MVGKSESNSDVVKVFDRQLVMVSSLVETPCGAQLRKQLRMNGSELYIHSSRTRQLGSEKKSKSIS